MANIKSAKKRILTIAKKTELNKSKKSAMKSAIKSVRIAAETNQAGDANEKLRAASKLVNKTASKGVIHKNKAARLVSRMAKKVNSIQG